MFDLMQYALIFYDFQLILVRMGRRPLARAPRLCDVRPCLPYPEHGLPVRIVRLGARRLRREPVPEECGLRLVSSAGRARAGRQLWSWYPRNAVCGIPSRPAVRNKTLRRGEGVQRLPSLPRPRDRPRACSMPTRTPAWRPPAMVWGTRPCAC